MVSDYLKKKRILLVDDEKELRELVLSILIEEGYGAVRTAGTAAEALQICREWRPEFAILDVMLPDGNGFSLFGEMKQTGDIPTLFLTARGEAEDRLKGLGAGADDYMAVSYTHLDVYKRQEKSAASCAGWIFSFSLCYCLQKESDGVG